MERESEIEARGFRRWDVIKRLSALYYTGKL
jgi:hypothetical protein